LRFQNAIVKPDDAGAEARARAADDARSLEEIELEIARATDKERAIGLLAGPLAAIIGLIVSGTAINYAKTHGQSLSVYEELTYVILGMSVLILVSALLRKRLFMGITMALYGLAIFNLKYWGFGVPFLMAGAWMLVRSYRLDQARKKIEGGGTVARRQKDRTPRTTKYARPNKRYTPPTAPTKRPAKPNPDKEQKAG
jgi:hypothetical protein